MNNNALTSYDGFNFYDNGIVLTAINHLTMPKRTNQLVKRANRNGALLPKSSLGEKIVGLSGYYNAPSAIAAQQMYDVLASAFNRQERPLIIPHAGSTRRYIATPETISIEEPDGLNRLTFSAEFVVPEGYAESQTQTTLFAETIISASTTIPFTIQGSVLARPLITLTYNSASSSGIQTMSIRNARDFVGLTFSRVFNGGDEIIINSATFQIYVNGQLVAPNGRMPTWAQGAGALYYSDTLTSRNVSATGSYNIGNL